MLAGTTNDGGLSMAFFILQFPSFSQLGGTIVAADFSVGFIGVGTRRSDAVLRVVNQTFGSISEIGISAPNDGLLKTRLSLDSAFIPLAESGGPNAIATSNKAAIATTMNSLWAGGANAGRYVVFDVTFSSFPSYPSGLDPVVNEAGFQFDRTGGSATYGNNPAQLSLVGTPEPSAAVLLVGSSLLLLGRRPRRQLASPILQRPTANLHPTVRARRDMVLSNIRWSAGALGAVAVLAAAVPSSIEAATVSPITSGTVGTAGGHDWWGVGTNISGNRALYGFRLKWSPSDLFWQQDVDDKIIYPLIDRIG